MDTEQLSMTKKTLVGVQFLFVAFGATVLVPLLIGIDPATALFTAGVGTFLFHFITKGKVPIFLGSIPLYVARGNSSGAGAYRRCICGECRSQEGFRGRSGIASHDVGRWTGMSLFSLSGRTS